MDPPLVGTSCGYTDCHHHDFLPIKCPACSKLYCTNHYFPEAHHCEGLESTSNDTGSSATKQTNLLPCALEGCGLPCLESYVAKDAGHDARTPATCSRCSLSFCSQHRFPDSHNCRVAVPPDPPKNKAARAILAKNFPSHDMDKKGGNTRNTGTSQKKLPKSQGTKLVQLMKMRQSATPGDLGAGHIDVKDRLHIRAKVNESDVYKPFWFRKSISTGRAFDLLQQRLELSPYKPWTLLKEFDDSNELPTSITVFDRPLSEEFEDGCKVTFIPAE